MQMPRSQATQLNVRSAFARKRVNELAKRTGLSATQIVEDALRAYVPPPAVAEIGKLVRRGRILVQPAEGARVTLKQANAALTRSREREE
jgi:hypothetical protein